MDNSVVCMTVLQNIENYMFSSVLKDKVFDIIQIENSVREVIYLTEFSISVKLLCEKNLLLRAC